MVQFIGGNGMKKNGVDLVHSNDEHFSDADLPRVQSRSRMPNAGTLICQLDGLPPTSAHHLRVSADSRGDLVRMRHGPHFPIPAPDFGA
jgi:hypothetical protein